MGLEPNDNLFNHTSAETEAGTEQKNGASSTAAVEEKNGQIVFAEGEHVLDEDKAKSIAQKYGIDFIKLSEVDLSPYIVHLLPQWLAVKHKVIAVKFEEDILYVAICNPLDLPTLEQIKLVTAFNVKPVVALEREIVQAIRQHYDTEQMTRQDLVDARFDQDQVEQTSESIEDSVISGEAGQAVQLINSLVKDAIESSASDIHLEPYGEEMVVRFRVDGILHDLMTIPSTIKKEVISRVKILASLDITEKRKAQDGHISFKHKEDNYDLRISVMPTIDGGKIVIRILDKNKLITDFAKLGINEQESALFDNIIKRPYGLVLVTGPTGSGKTTTLYSMLHSINAIEKNVVTIENPVEYKLGRINQIQIDPNTGETFAGALRSILRQDPDVIMVGEIRDFETAEIAVQAALTGHLVFSTLHTNDSVTAIIRLRELGIPSFLIASCVVLSVAQRLVRRICPDCKEEYQPEGETLKMLGLDKQAPGKFMHGRGCGYCFDTGFRGREGIFEIFKIDNDIQIAILQEKDALEIKKMAVQKGMKTLLDAAVLKVSEGVTSVGEVKRVIAVEKF